MPPKCALHGDNTSLSIEAHSSPYSYVGTSDRLKGQGGCLHGGEEEDGQESAKDRLRMFSKVFRRSGGTLTFLSSLFTLAWLSPPARSDSNLPSSVVA